MLCDLGDDCEFIGDEPLDKKTKKLTNKLEKEERKNSDMELVQGKKGKSRGKIISSLNVDSLIGVLI